MPAKKIVTREFILNTAFEMARKVGMDGINMRDLAKACNCSTQPIYLSFKGADEIKREVFKMAINLYKETIQKEIGAGIYSEYKALGMGYIRFARQENQLFKDMFMRVNNNYKDEGYWSEMVSFVAKKLEMPKSDAELLHSEMWVFVHGIAVMSATGYLDWGWELIGEMLTDAFLGISMRFENKNKG